MSKSILLITPPFTQLNTPYPATAYLKGFLNTKNIDSFQCDLGIEVTLKLFSKSGLEIIFREFKKNEFTSENSIRIYSLKESYCQTIEIVIRFLQGKNPLIAHSIAQRSLLPEASRFATLQDVEHHFGTMGVQDKAKYFATLYLEDLSDFIKECIDPHFGFSRYAERLARSANSFDEIYETLQKPTSLIDNFLINSLEEKINKYSPKLIAMSAPFPGNVFSTFRIGQYVKKNHPNIKLVLGGGFANTELRSLSDSRVFEFIDFITLDDGEAPFENLINYLENKLDTSILKRTYLVENNKVVYKNESIQRDYKQHEVGTPDYSDLLLHEYISAIEVTNPMHRLWSDGRWNKLTMAHGCYWGKCTFCDISLDYIKNYEPITAKLLCDRMETIINQTGDHGFHFVDEAAPPSLMKELAIEILRRNIQVSWWTNIRFEKSFTRDLCFLLKASGCIGVSGGLEVASDRLLALIQKGVTVEQVTQVNKNFTQAGIMVHAYLMYGFPTQTAQETIDSLEIVRQMFQNGILQSGFWHQFAMTAHSPVGINPAKFGVEKVDNIEGKFANNDIIHVDKKGAIHEDFSFGLKKSLYNYMNGIGFDQHLNSWFEHKTPKTSIEKDFIEKILNETTIERFRSNQKAIWIGESIRYEIITKSKKGNQWEMALINISTKKENYSFQVSKQEGKWFCEILRRIKITNSEPLTMQEIKDDFEKNGLEDFDLFWFNKPINQLYKYGLLVV